MIQLILKTLKNIPTIAIKATTINAHPIYSLIARIGSDMKKSAAANIRIILITGIIYTPSLSIAEET